VYGRAAVRFQTRRVIVTQRKTPPGVFLSSSQRPPRSGRAVRILVVLGLAIVLVAVALGAFWLSERGTLPARTVIGGIEVGGKSTAEARRLVAGASRKLVRRPVELRFTGDFVTVTGSQLGARPRVEEAIERADGTGLFARIVRKLRFRETRAVPLRFDLNPQRLRLLGDELDRHIASEPRDAVLRVTRAGTAVEPAVEGRAVGRRALRARLRLLPPSLSVPVTVVRPQVSTAAAEHARVTVEALLSEPRTVALHTSKARLSPGVLRKALVLEPSDGSLTVGLNEEVLRRRLGKAFSDMERPARDASFRIVGGSSAQVVASRTGKELDVERISRSLVNNLESTVHRARFEAVAPTLTTEEAEALEIHELVSEFTTYYTCCAPRVTNIQRAAELLDGTVLGRGETFSLNGALGKRTAENGFVTAPQIFDGRLEDAVGGGISQVATTMYNAAFFAGLRLDTHQAHQFYISRYPMGREATVSWGGPELVFTNDWDAGLLIKVSAWSTGIAVRFFSSKLDRRVETVTEQPYAYRQPTTRTTKNPKLKPGEKVVLQDAGGPGFTVQYTRKVYRGSKLVRDERFRVRYDPQNGYIEIGPKKKKKKPKTTPPGALPGAPTDGRPGDPGAPTTPSNQPGTETTPPT
jgi:vancomycin resistance protein YoaR